MSHKGFLFSLASVAIMGISGQQTWAITDSERETKAVMNQVYESYINIVPFIYSNVDLDKKNSEVLLGHLNNISEAFKKAKHVDMLQIPGFKPSLDTINIHLKETIDSLNAKNTIFAKARLQAMTSLCMNCHGQIGESVAKNAFGESLYKVNRQGFASDFEYANYLFLVRRYTEAQTFYDRTLSDALAKNQKGSEGQILDDKVVNGEIFSSLRRLLAINVKISFKPEKAIKILEKYQANKSLSKLTRNDVDSWLNGLKLVKNLKLNKFTTAKSFIDTYLTKFENDKEALVTGKEDITLLMASGFLSKYLSEKKATDETPEILYWLSIAERRLSHSYFFSLSDLYLKECIAQFPASPWAKKCFAEYEEALTFGYTGSGGTEIPREEKRELDRLRSLIK
ncbi:MAG: hypothetical protein L6Q33_05180 [Bacteriovoracaceae bacterium]|nr:hypothetical protein [Bacteriovoracaceae bacterium]